MNKNVNISVMKGALQLDEEVEVHAEGEELEWECERGCTAQAVG